MIRELMFGGVATAAAAGIYFHGPLQSSGETYDRPLAETYRIVEATPLPSLFDKMVTGTRDESVTRGGEPQKSMVWYFHAKGQQIGKYTVEVAPAGDKQTRVKTSFEMADNAEKVMGKGFAIHGSDQFAVIGHASMNEQIDSRLDGRAFDTAKISHAMTAYIAANLSGIQGQALESFDQASAQFKEADAERAYSKAQADNARFKPGEPMVR
ncbi:hypothetical protein [Sphingomonas sp. LT1P40]|uniref:hypothetical protein n=1 Tax=Alteristakelama amylovorans TaxID=3096166 RepID=UPI002FCC0B59